MNRTNSSKKSILSDSQASKKSFRVLVKNRTTHQILESQQQKNKNENQLMKSTIQHESFESVKNNLKKYIRNMKVSSKFTSYDSKVNTNRSSRQLSENQSKIISSRSNILSTKHLSYSLRSSFVQKKQKNKIHVEETHSLSSHDNSHIVSKPSVRYHTESQEQPFHTKLPSLKAKFEQHQQQNNFNEDPSIKQTETSSRQRICDLQSKIQNILGERLKMLSTSNSFSINNEVKNKTVYKLLQNEMDKILQQIRKIKENEQNIENTIEHQAGDKDTQINKNIQMFEKKVKIIERLIAEKLFESDNLKNQYLRKIKQHRRFISEASFGKKSKSSNFYRDANKLNPSNFKPLPYEKQPVCTKDMTTNLASFKIPMKSYYITPQKDHFYNANKLTQPLPRSTYNCQYLIYGALPKDLITMASGQPDHKIIANTLSQDKQKSILQGSTYKQDYRKKIEKEPINFKQLDCYKDKFKNLQVNYGQDKNDYKVVNSQSVIQFYEEGKRLTLKKELSNNSTRLKRTQNPQAIKSSLMNSHLKISDAKMKVQELRQTIDQLQQSQAKDSMIEQEKIRKDNLFNQRIKSEIKHKNVYDQKYKFKNELIKEKIRKMEDSSRRQRLTSSLTLQY